MKPSKWSWYNKDFVSRENRIAQLKEEQETEYVEIIKKRLAENGKS